MDKHLGKQNVKKVNAKYRFVNERISSAHKLLEDKIRLEKPFDEKYQLLLTDLVRLQANKMQDTQF